MNPFILPLQNEHYPNMCSENGRNVNESAIPIEQIEDIVNNLLITS